MLVTRITWHNNDNFTIKAMALMEYDIVCMAAKANITGLQADDIAQELRIRLYEQLNMYDCYQSSLRTWALKVLKNHLRNLNVAMSETFKRKANKDLLSLEKWLEVGKISDTNDLDVLLALKKLPKLEKAIIHCLFFKNMTQKDTAIKINCSQKKVKAIKELAKQRLRLLLV